MTAYEREQQERLAGWIDNDTHAGPMGELRWDTNDQPVPMDTFRDADRTPPARQAAAIGMASAKAAAEYRLAAERSEENRNGVHGREAQDRQLAVDSERAFELRAVMMPTSTPLFFRIFIPKPSRALKDLISSPCSV